MAPISFTRPYGLLTSYGPYLSVLSYSQIQQVHIEGHLHKESTGESQRDWANLVPFQEAVTSQLQSIAIEEEFEDKLGI